MDFLSTREMIYKNRNQYQQKKLQTIKSEASCVNQLSIISE